MNIIIRPYGSDSCYCRPDTTWERENKDFYSPEDVNGLDWAPILFVRISKAGKCIGGKFASRYYDAFGFGALMYISDLMPSIASASCADHTSILPFPLYNPTVLENESNEYQVSKGGAQIFNLWCGPSVRADIEEAICTASRLTSLRIGDFVAIELAPISPLAARPGSSLPDSGTSLQNGTPPPDCPTSLKATFCENELFDFKVIF